MKAAAYTVLLLSAPIGSGHRLAAEALQQELERRPGIRVVHGNVFDFFPHFLGSAFLHSYLWILGRCPQLYELAYKWGNGGGGSLRLRSLLNGALALLGRSYLEKLQPDAVIATHATPAGIISCYKKRHPELWLGAAVTDFTIHRWWLCEGVDTYFVADSLLCGRFAAGADVQPLGIPVRQEFQHPDREAGRQTYGWRQDERVCLLMGGGEGLLPMESIIDALSRAEVPGLRLVAVTGHNAGLKTVLRRRFGKQAEIYGFRRDVPQLLAAADILVTKAGGLTAAEALAAGTELLIYKPLPGQEEGNARFLQEHCGARVARNLTELVQYIRPDSSAREDVSCHRGKPLAARNIVSYMLSRL